MSIAGALLLGLVIQWGMWMNGAYPEQCTPNPETGIVNKHCPQPTTKQVWPIVNEGGES